jgi:hypothetical protein
MRTRCSTAPYVSIWGPRTWLAYAKELVRGRLPGAAQGDKLSWVGTCSSSPKER